MDDLGLDEKIKWQSWLSFYFLWGLTVVLSFIIFFAARAAFKMLLFYFATKEWISWAWVNLIEKFLVVIIGVAVLGFIVFAQDYFYRALMQNLLFNKFARVFGIALLILFLFNLILILLTPFSLAGIIFAGLELIFGIILIFILFNKKPA